SRGAVRIPPGVSPLRFDLSGRQHSRGPALDFEFRLGPLLHRNRTRRASAGRRVACSVVQSCGGRRNRLEVLSAGVAKAPPDATDGVGMANVFSYVVSPRLVALMRKEFQQIARDRRLAASLTLQPVVQMLLLGFALSATVTNLRLGVVDQSQ